MPVKNCEKKRVHTRSMATGSKRKPGNEWKIGRIKNCFGKFIIKLSMPVFFSQSIQPEQAYIL